MSRRIDVQDDVKTRTLDGQISIDLRGRSLMIISVFSSQSDIQKVFINE